MSSSISMEEDKDNRMEAKYNPRDFVNEAEQMDTTVNPTATIPEILAEYFKNNPDISEQQKTNIMTDIFAKTNERLQDMSNERQRITDQKKADMLIAAIKIDLNTAREESAQAYQMATNQNAAMAASLPPEDLLKFLVQQREILETIWATTRTISLEPDDLVLQQQISRILYDQIYEALMIMINGIRGGLDRNKFSIIISAIALLSCSGLPLYAIVGTAMTGIINTELKQVGENAAEQQTLSDFFRDNLTNIFTCGYNAAAGIGSMICLPLYKVVETGIDLRDAAVVTAFKKSLDIGKLIFVRLDEAQSLCMQSAAVRPDSQASDVSDVSVASNASNASNASVVIKQLHSRLNIRLNAKIPVIRILDNQLGELAQTVFGLSQTDLSQTDLSQTGPNISSLPHYRDNDDDDSDKKTKVEGGRRPRKSRRYKKRRSTLKRRRMKRRRTKKGKKRRHTKKRR